MTCSILDFYLVSFHFIRSRSNQFEHFWRINSFATKRWQYSEILWAVHTKARRRKKNQMWINNIRSVEKQWKQKKITNAHFITARCLVYLLACEAIHRFFASVLLYSFRFNAYKYKFCLFHSKKNIVFFSPHFYDFVRMLYNQNSHLIWDLYFFNI